MFFQIKDKVSIKYLIKKNPESWILNLQISFHQYFLVLSSKSPYLSALDLISSSRNWFLNLIITACVACKNPIQNRQKIKYKYQVQKSISWTRDFKDQVQIDRRYEIFFICLQLLCATYKYKLKKCFDFYCNDKLFKGEIPNCRLHVGLKDWICILFFVIVIVIVIVIMHISNVCLLVLPKLQAKHCKSTMTMIMTGKTRYMPPL